MDFLLDSAFTMLSTNIYSMSSFLASLAMWCSCCLYMRLPAKCLHIFLKSDIGIVSEEFREVWVALEHHCIIQSRPKSCASTSSLLHCLPLFVTGLFVFLRRCDWLCADSACHHHLRLCSARCPPLPLQHLLVDTPSLLPALLPPHLARQRSSCTATPLPVVFRLPCCSLCCGQTDQLESQASECNFESFFSTSLLVLWFVMLCQ